MGAFSSPSIPPFDRPDLFHPLPSIPSHTSHRTTRVAATPNQPHHHHHHDTGTQAHTNTHTHTPKRDDGMATADAKGMRCHGPAVVQMRWRVGEHTNVVRAKRSTDTSLRHRRMRRCDVGSKKRNNETDEAMDGSNEEPSEWTSQEMETNVPRGSKKDAVGTTGMRTALRTSGLLRAPLSAGISNVTAARDLPTEAKAVRNLLEQARYATLCTIMSQMHHRRAGYPFGSIVDFAIDETGCPLFSLSSLAIHTRNILADPRCTITVQMPGWSGLANARATLFGDIYPLDDTLQNNAQAIFVEKHQKHSSAQWGNFSLFRMHRISDIYFVGGFGTVQWVDVKEYFHTQPDAVVKQDPLHTVQVLTEKFSQDICRLMTQVEEDRPPADDASCISIDRTGVDVRVRRGAQFSVERIGFPRGVHNLEEAISALEEIIGNAAS